MLPAWESNDADAFAEVFTQDASFIVPNEGTYLAGREEIRAYMAAGFAGPLDGVRATAEVVDVKCVGTDVGVVITEGGLLLPGESAVPPDRLGRQSWVVVDQDDGWAVTAYQNSRLAPQSEGAGPLGGQ